MPEQSDQELEDAIRINHTLRHLILLKKSVEFSYALQQIYQSDKALYDLTSVEIIGDIIKKYDPEYSTEMKKTIAEIVEKFYKYRDKRVAIKSEPEKYKGSSMRGFGRWADATGKKNDKIISNYRSIINREGVLSAIRGYDHEQRNPKQWIKYWTDELERFMKLGPYPTKDYFEAWFEQFQKIWDSREKQDPLEKIFFELITGMKSLFINFNDELKIVNDLLKQSADLTDVDHEKNIRIEKWAKDQLSARLTRKVFGEGEGKQMWVNRMSEQIMEICKKNTKKGETQKKNHKINDTRTANNFKNYWKTKYVSLINDEATDNTTSFYEDFKSNVNDQEAEVKKLVDDFSKEVINLKNFFKEAIDKNKELTKLVKKEQGSMNSIDYQNAKKIKEWVSLLDNEKSDLLTKIEQNLIIIDKKEEKTIATTIEEAEKKVTDETERKRLQHVADVATKEKQEQLKIEQFALLYKEIFDDLKNINRTYEQFEKRYEDFNLADKEALKDWHEHIIQDKDFFMDYKLNTYYLSQNNDAITTEQITKATTWITSFYGLTSRWSPLETAKFKTNLNYNQLKALNEVRQKLINVNEAADTAKANKANEEAADKEAARKEAERKDNARIEAENAARETSAREKAAREAEKEAAREAAEKAAGKAADKDARKAAEKAAGKEADKTARDAAARKKPAYEKKAKGSPPTLVDQDNKPSERWEDFEWYDKKSMDFAKHLTSDEKAIMFKYARQHEIMNRKIKQLHTNMELMKSLPLYNNSNFTSTTNKFDDLLCQVFSVDKKTFVLDKLWKRLSDETHDNQDQILLFLWIQDTIKSLANLMDPNEELEDWVESFEIVYMTDQFTDQDTILLKIYVLFSYIIANGCSEINKDIFLEHMRNEHTSELFRVNQSQFAPDHYKRRLIDYVRHDTY